MSTWQKIKIIKRSKALKILKSDKKNWNGKWCTGKYVWKGSQMNWIGDEWEVADYVLALYVISNQDSDGAYATVMCVVDGSLKQPYITI